MSGEEYEFHIDAYTPTTIPMARLAQYLSELAALIGQTERVHFTRLKSGSVQIVAKVEREAAPKVRVRLQNALDPEAPPDVRRPYIRLDEMLRADNAVAKLMRGSANIVRFPGRTGARSPRMGPFTEQAEVDGRIVRIGGTDDTAHALIEDGEGEVWSAECTRELAIQLAHYLYGDPLRLSGNARWERDEAGKWELLSFRAKDFHPLLAEDLATALNTLRRIDAQWKRDEDPTALLRQLREGSEEAH
jgi:hypothetical protein